MKYSRHPQKYEAKDPVTQKKWDDLKDVLCDNEHMLDYLIMVDRPVSLGSLSEVWFTLNSETSNIYSHLLAFLLFVFISFKCDPKCLIVTVCTAITYFGSIIYHTFRTFSRKLYDITLCFDVSGIAIQIFSFSASDLLIFFWSEQSQKFWRYMSVLTFLFVSTLTALPFILKYKIYWLRTVLFISMSSLCIPILYDVYQMNGMNDTFRQLLNLRFYTYLFHGVSLIFRSGHIPERWAPHSIWQKYFHSHFFFHVAVLIGSCFGYFSVSSLVGI